MTRNQIVELYSATFNRAADADGVAYWETQTNLTQEQMANSFVISAEAVALYPATQTNTEYVTAIYNNLFGRAPDDAGLAYWVGKLDDGTDKKESMIAAFINGAAEADKKVLDNKTAVSLYAVEQGSNTTTVSLSSVTADPATVTAAKTAVDEASPNFGETFMLTTGSDKIVASDYELAEGETEADVTRSTEKNDLFKADLLTVNDGDNLDGGAGTDTLNMEINANVTDKFVSANIENVNVSTFGANEINMKNITGVETLTTTNSTGKITLKNIGDAALGFGFKGSSTNDIDAQYAAGKLSGTSDTLKVSLNNAKEVSLKTPAGFETVSIDATGTNDFAALTTPGVSTYTVTGTGSINFTDELTNVKTISATGMSGDFTTGTVGTDGFVDGVITTGTNGASVLLGSGNDNIGFSNAAAATKSSTVKLGAGDDKLSLNVSGNGATYVFGEAGNDDVILKTGILDASDLIDLGAGTDTLTLDAAGANKMVLRGVENLTLNKGATGANEIESADSALNVTAKVDSSAVSITGLTAGSTFTTVKDAAAATAGTTINVGFKAAEAASTLTLGAGASGTITTNNITAVTIEAAEALSTKGSAFTFTTATDVTINGAKDVKGTVAIADSKLENLTITSSKAIDMGDTANVAALKTVSATATEDAKLGTIDSKVLTDVTVTSTKGAAEVGNISATAGTTEAINVTVSGATTAKTGIINTSGKEGKVGNVTVTATKGLLTAAAISATEAGTIDLTSTAGGIALTTTGIVAADKDGITVNMNAKDFINITGATGGTKAFVKNTDGDVTATVSGAAAAKIDYTAGTASTAAKAGVVNLTATNTGGLETTVTNHTIAGEGETSTIYLGDAKSGAENKLTTDGVVDNLVVNGGTGQDTFTIGDDAHKTVTIDLGGSLGTTLDKVDLTDAVATGTAKDATATTGTGLVINLGADATVDGDTVAANTAVEYLATAAADAKIDTTGTSYSINGVESVVGTAQADYIIANNEGSTIDGGAGADIIVAGAGQDTLTGGSEADTFVFGVGTSGLTATTIDKITDFAKTDDSLKTGEAGSAVDDTTLNFAEVTAATYDELSDIITAANTSLATTLTTGTAATKAYAYILVTGAAGDLHTTDTAYVAIDDNVDGTVDQLIEIVGGKTTDVTAADFIA